MATVNQMVKLQKNEDNNENINALYVDQLIN